VKKVKLKIEERLTYRREVIVKIPESMDESELNKALNLSERKSEFIDDLIHYLGDFGIECPDGYDDDLSSPDTGEVECYEYSFLD